MKSALSKPGCFLSALLGGEQKGASHKKFHAAPS